MCIKRQLGHKSLGNAHPGPAEPLQGWDCTDWMDPHYPGTDARRAAALQPPGASLQTWFAPSLKRSLAGEFTHPRRIPRGRRPRLAVGVLLSWPRHFHPLSPPGLSGSDHTPEQGWQHPFHGLLTRSSNTSPGCGSRLARWSTKITRAAGFLRQQSSKHNKEVPAKSHKVRTVRLG